MGRGLRSERVLPRGIVLAGGGRHLPRMAMQISRLGDAFVRSGRLLQFFDRIETANLNGTAVERGARETSQHIAGIRQQEDEAFAGHVSKGDDFFVVEIETDAAISVMTPEILREQPSQLNQIKARSDQEELFDLPTRLLLHVTRFDRLEICRFDRHWNGEIVAEAKRGWLRSE